MIHVPNRRAGIGHRYDQNEALLIGDVMDLKMINAANGLRDGTGWHWTIIIGPTCSYIRGEDLGIENSPGKEDCSSGNE